MTTLATRSKAAFSMISSSAIAASRGIDTFGNRLLFITGAAAVGFERTFVKTAAEFERYQTMLNSFKAHQKLELRRWHGLKSSHKTPLT
ncbi:hypothetical protein, partial [Klebsiella pneumoniae]|uniref:hypothetical protein n=1 Tax=Klebsiella pneumoniae TaxID=573 RepID=UPI001D0E6E64